MLSLNCGAGTQQHCFWSCHTGAIKTQSVSGNLIPHKQHWKQTGTPYAINAASPPLQSSSERRFLAAQLLISCMDLFQKCSLLSFSSFSLSEMQQFADITISFHALAVMLTPWLTSFSEYLIKMQQPLHKNFFFLNKAPNHDVVFVIMLFQLFFKMCFYSKKCMQCLIEIHKLQRFHIKLLEITILKVI